MSVWLAIQFLGALLSALGGLLVAMNAKSAIHEIEAILLIGLGSLVMAVIGVGAMLAGKAEEQAQLLRDLRARPPAPPPVDTQSPLLREIRDRLPPLSASAAPAAQAPTPTTPAPLKRAGGAPWGQKTCPACRAFNDEYARTCTHCGVAFPPSG